ncbi:hypothetical protein [Pseudomonas lactucae]|uniref:hypothetical protein n=1 Tax=Pseudomonas lactucae TaxID=2813360 RepID=UPI001CEC3E5A|nr:hypothetical protein [Pseudomonas lactucae]
MPSPNLSTPSVAQAVSATFASRPTFESVVQRTFTAAISEHYPGLALDWSTLQLALPVAGGAWRFEPFAAKILDYLASGTPVDFNEVGALAPYLTQRPPTPIKTPTGHWLDMHVIDTLVRELPWSVPIGLQNALTDYWNPTPEDATNRWRWLSDTLRDTLQLAALQQPDLSDAARQTLQQVINCPAYAQRVKRYGTAATYAYTLETRLHHDNQDSALLSPQLMLVRTVNTDTVVLLCQPDGTLRTFASVDALGQYWSEHVAGHYIIEAVTWERYEVQGSVFEHQAALILNQQLQHIGALRLPSDLGLSNLQALYRDISDPAHAFLDEPQTATTFENTLREKLPGWLQHASTEQRAAYRRHSLGLASNIRLNKGQTFLSDITDIHGFTVNALTQALETTAKGSAAAPESYHPDNVQLTFTHYIGAIGAVGIPDIQRMSLTELAIRNLVGQPKGTLTLAHSDGLPLPAWLTPDYITRGDGLIERVDIGTTYPDYLKQQLLSESPQALARQRLFADQLRDQLPLMALELHLKNEASITNLGARYVAALVQSDPDERRVDGNAVVLRCLALLRNLEAPMDVVANMFIIEALDNTTGPHLLYRPLYPDALREFATREDLLNAIAQPGALQTSVLTWLPEAARPVYDNGGFLEPHYIRFGLGDEFAPITTPSPAYLADNGASHELLQYLLNGQLFDYLYGSNAGALIDQASTTAVSTRSSRWQMLLETGGAVFASLVLPLLRGPALLSAWLVTLAASLEQDVPALQSQDPVTRELAGADVLISLAGVLGDLVPVTTRATPLPSPLRQQALRPPAPRLLPEQWPRPKTPSVNEGAVMMAGHEPDARGSALDLSFASGRNRLSAEQTARLLRLRVPRPATLPAPVMSGPRKGLYVIYRTWHVLLDENLYRLNLLSDGSVAVIDPFDASRQGPFVKADAQGHWSVDLNLRLRGGMPPKRIAAERQRKAQRKIQLEDQWHDFLAQQVPLQRAADIAQSVMERSEQDTRFTPQQLAAQRRQFDAALQRQTAQYQALLESVDERLELGIALPAQTVLAFMENTINNARKSVVMAEKDRAQLYLANSRFTTSGLPLPYIIAREYTRYLGFIKELSDINERAMVSLDLRDRHLASLYSQGAEGIKVFERLTADRPEAEISFFSVAGLQLMTLRALTVKQASIGLLEGLDALIDPLRVQVRSHSELKTLELSPVELREALESLVEQYGQALDGLQGIREVNAEELEPHYFDKMFTLIERFYTDASQQLANEIKPEPKPRKRPPKRPKISTGRPQKKLIKTHAGAVLIGDLKPAGTRYPTEAVEIHAEDDQQLIATYLRDNGAWRVLPSPSPPQPAAPARPLNVVKGEARKLFAMLEEHFKRAERYKTLCRYPQEIEELMNQDAIRLDTVAGELDKAILAQPTESRLAADQALVEAMREGVLRLKRKGHELRTALSLALPPTHGNLQFLFDQQLIQVARLGERIALTGTRKDFIQEYAINDRRGYPLWYAHFHYATANTPKADYGVAHLKTIAQRKQSYYSLLDTAHSPQAVVDVHRAMLGKNLAERWFLPLAP